MTIATLNKHSKRTAVTRAKLVAAAYKIFVKEGFSGASLEAVAKKAGYTRGAFYANFDDKEDLLFAVYEHQLAEIVNSLRIRVHLDASSHQRIAAMRDYYMELIDDQNLLLFLIEFRLYVIRNTGAFRRLRNLRATGLAELDAFLKTAFSDCNSELQMRPERMHRIFIGLLYGLRLETLFRPEYFSKEDASIEALKLFEHIWMPSLYQAD